ncbi:MAG: hypothetical protein FWE03_06245 [Firmicutes bacterium]|nr:hypothetical protein [Bacillota bacterium]
MNTQRIYIMRGGSSDFVSTNLITTNGRIIIHNFGLTLGTNTVKVVATGICYCAGTAIPIEAKPAFLDVTISSIVNNQILTPRDFRMSPLNNNILIWTICQNNLLRTVYLYCKKYGFEAISFGGIEAISLTEFRLPQGYNRFRIITNCSTLINGVLFKITAPIAYVTVYNNSNGQIHVVS